MLPKEIVSRIMDPVMRRQEARRHEVLRLAFDRGLREGMQIEKWILAEMLAELTKLRNEELLDDVEGEHKYRRKKTTRHEHCDLWWKAEGKQHWLEVKTIVISRDKQRGSIEEIAEDLEKKDRLNQNDIFHHLTIVFPIKKADIGNWKRKLCQLYGENGLGCVADWNNYKVWDGQMLLAVLASSEV